MQHGITVYNPKKCKEVEAYRNKMGTRTEGNGKWEVWSPSPPPTPILTYYYTVSWYIVKGALIVRAHFLGLFWNENRRNGNDLNYWNMKQEKKNDCSKSGLKTDHGFLPQARLEN